MGYSLLTNSAKKLRYQTELASLVPIISRNLSVLVQNKWCYQLEEKDCWILGRPRKKIWRKPIWMQMPIGTNYSEMSNFLQGGKWGVVL